MNPGTAEGEPGEQRGPNGLPRLVGGSTTRPGPAGTGDTVCVAMGCGFSLHLTTRPKPATPAPPRGMQRVLMTCSARWHSGGVPAVPGGLLAPRDRNKTLTALAEAEPVTGAGHPQGY